MGRGSGTVATLILLFALAATLVLVVAAPFAAAEPAASREAAGEDVYAMTASGEIRCRYGRAGATAVSRSSSPRRCAHPPERAGDPAAQGTAARR
jgi:uncharacterized membrane protein